MKDHIKELEAVGACEGGRTWAKRYRTAQKAWEVCKRPDWMLWYLAKKLDRKSLCTILGKIAMDTPLGDGRTTWDIMPEVGRECLRVLRRWIDGRAKEAELTGAFAATRIAAANAADADAHAAAYATNAAAYAADAHAASRKWQCNLIRERYPDIEAVRAKAEGRAE